MNESVIQVRQMLEQFNKDFRWWDQGLSGACLIASYLVKESFKSKGIESSIYSGRIGTIDHCWIETDNQLIDITFSQFDSKVPILFLEKDSEQYKNMPTTSKIRHLDSDEFNNWRFNQKPQYFIDQKRKLYKEVV